MNWEDECYLISKNLRNANIVNVFSPIKKNCWIIYGKFKKNKKIQISNKLFVLNNSKNDNKIGYFKTELIKAISPIYFNNKEKTSALISLCSILNSLLPESQPYKNIYKSFEKFIESLELENWLILYIFFELNLIKELGYDTNLKIFYNSNDDIYGLKNIKIDGYNYEVPNFLTQQQVPTQISKKLLQNSIIFTRSVL